MVGAETSTIGRVWDGARKAALTSEEYGSKLARRLYDLRHACVSTWLYLSPHTVRDHVKAVFDETRVSSRGELVRSCSPTTRRTGM